MIPGWPGETRVEPVVEAEDQFVGGVARPVEIERHGEHPLGIEAGIQRLQREQAPQHEPGAHQQHHRDRHLGHHQRARGRGASPPPLTAAPPSFKRGHQVGPGRKRRQHGEGEAGEHADQQRKGEHLAVERDLRLRAA